jgi:hypothetical protein
MEKITRQEQLVCLLTYHNWKFKRPSIMRSFSYPNFSPIFRRFREIAEGDYYLHVRPSVRTSAWNNSTPTERTVMNYFLRICLEN